MHVNELGGEYYRFDEVRQGLRGERTGIRYVIGARVRVQVSRVDLDGRRIDFRMVQEGEGDRLLSRGRSSGRGEGGAVEALADVKSADRQQKRATRQAKSGAAPAKRKSKSSASRGGAGNVHPKASGEERASKSPSSAARSPKPRTRR